MSVIVVGYDDSDSAKRALERASELAAASGARVIVTSVARPRVPAARGIGPIDPIDPPELHEEDLRHARTFLSEHGVAGEYAIALGDPASEIVRLAEECAAELIVVGTREPSLISRLLGLSVSEGVQRKARCDVLIVH